MSRNVRQPSFSEVASRAPAGQLQEHQSKFGRCTSIARTAFNVQQMTVTFVTWKAEHVATLTSTGDYLKPASLLRNPTSPLLSCKISRLVLTICSTASVSIGIRIPFQLEILLIVVVARNLIHRNGNFSVLMQYDLALDNYRIQAAYRCLRS